MWKLEENNRIILTHVIAWGFFISILLSFSYIQHAKLDIGILIRILLTTCIFYFSFLFATPRYLLENKIWQFIVCAVICIFCFWQLFLLIQPKPFRLNQMIAEQLDETRLEIFKNVILITVATLFFMMGTVTRFVLFNHRRVRKLQEAKHSQTLQELSSLRNQLNPHFLFNSLNSIYSLVRSKKDNAGEAVLILSNLMRHSLTESEKQLVDLQGEIDYIMGYIDLQKLRYTSSTHINFNVNFDQMGYKIAPSLFIPLVENSFKYADVDTSGPQIEIDLNVSDGKLCFYIKNKIAKNLSHIDGTGLGIPNLRQRLELLYNNSFKFGTATKEDNFIVNLEILLNDHILYHSGR